MKVLIYALLCPKEIVGSHFEKRAISNLTTNHMARLLTIDHLTADIRKPFDDI